MIKKLKELLSPRTSQKVGEEKEERPDDRIRGQKGNFAVAGITTGRKAEGRIITPIGPACRRSYHG